MEPGVCVILPGIDGDMVWAGDMVQASFYLTHGGGVDGRFDLEAMLFNVTTIA